MEREGFVDFHEPDPIQVRHVGARLALTLPFAVGVQHQTIGLATRTEPAVDLEVVHRRAVVVVVFGAVVEGQAQGLLLVGGILQFGVAMGKGVLQAAPELSCLNRATPCPD